MIKTVINATDVRNDFFHLLDLVATTGNPVYIKKDREVKVKLEPVGDEITKRWIEVEKWLNETRNMWADRSENEIRGRFKEADRKTTLRIRKRK